MKRPVLAAQGGYSWGKRRAIILSSPVTSPSHRGWRAAAKGKEDPRIETERSARPLMNDPMPCTLPRCERAIKKVRFPRRFCLTMLVKYYRLIIVTFTRSVRFFKRIPFNHIWGIQRLGTVDLSKPITKGV
jgi:hypothetical protein